MTILAQDYQYCRDVIKQHSKSFYYAFQQLPESEANAVYTVYTFCRMADDIVDQSGTSQFKTAQLQRFTQQFEQFAAGDKVDEPVWRALTDVRSRYQLEMSMFKMQLDGQKMDLSFAQPETLEDLRHYSLYVAGSVGRMLLPILSNDLSDDMKRKSEELGIAMQITNILRDVGEDYTQHQRIYIPVQLMKQFNYTSAHLNQLEKNKQFIAMWENLARYAEHLYDTFYQSIDSFKEEARLPLLLSAMVYREILNEVRKNDYNCLTVRNQVSLMTKHQLKRKAKIYLDGRRLK